MTVIRSLILAAALTGASSAALAGPVVLKSNPVDDDGRVTLGDIFDGAGGAANVVVAQRVGPSVVLEAGQLQAQAAQAGLQWDNPTGLRRIAVRRSSGPVAPSVEATASTQVQAALAAPTRVAYRPGASPSVIDRNDMVRVSYDVGGVRLSLMGKAMRSAGIGEPVAILNTTSNRVIDAVATGPGQAVAGPAADAARANPQQFAAR